MVEDEARRGWRQEPTSSVDEYYGDREEVEEEEEPIPTRPTHLRAKGSRWDEFGCEFVLLIMALFWTIFLSVMLFQCWPEGQEGGLFFTLILILLVIGLLRLIRAIYTLIYTFLALFNPVPVVLLDNAHLTPGSRSGVRWTFRGNPSRLRSLTLSLVGRESATYRRGTTTHTDEEDFCDMVVFQSQVPAEMAAGSVELVVPQPTMHTFSARHNKIEWLVRLRAEIPFWPDVQEEFPVTVYPS